MSEFPQHTGGGWYELSNGEKVQGAEAAAEAELALEEAPVADEPVEEVADEAVDPEPESEAMKEYVEDVEDIAEGAQEMLVRFTGANVRRQLNGKERVYEFTRDNPFAVVAAEDADYILSKPGFERATPAQVERYYE